MRYYRDISLSDKSYHYFTRTVSRDGKQRSAHRHVNSPWIGVHAFQLNPTAVSIRLLLFMFKDGAPNVLLRLTETRQIWQTYCLSHIDISYVKQADGKRLGTVVR
jgi:hypothetical protein